MKRFLFISFLFLTQEIFSQNEDSIDNWRLSQMIQLSEVVVRNKLDINAFIQHVKHDTTFYKAFRNLRILSFTSMNDIRMVDKKGKVKATLQSKTRQHVSKSCRSMEVINESVTGDFYGRDGEYNYYTAELYASLFFTKDQVCGETNIVAGTERDVRAKKGIEKNKEQLKMLFFDPGKKIPGIPLMGDKTAIFGVDNADKYNFSIDFVDYNGQSCYLFTIKAKSKSGVVIDNMTTWFSSKTMQIVARNYDLSYDAGVYDFNVHMEVQMTQFGNLTVPATLRYHGTWDVAFKKRERGVFTATLFDFNR
ncbi:MAG TPA: hypothetical protein VJ765_11340 [Chitinophagaceae bacterium]|nr:hypothetical protein [Chitinophagaceae bacterium]